MCIRDSYSEAWANEAEKRGLPNVKTTPTALDAYTTKKAKEIFSKNNILSEKEQEARHEIYLENYIKKVEIESSLVEELTMNQILPACIRFQTDLFQNIKASSEAGIPNKTAQTIAKSVSAHIDEVYAGIEKMKAARSKVHHLNTTRDKAIALCDQVKPLFLEIRSHVDDLELLVEDKYWPLPKYREILFNR